MKKIELLAALVAIAFALVGPATVLAADPAGSEPKSPEAIASVIPSRFLPGDAVVSGAASDQTAPVIAAGGNTMLAVWSDKRSYPAGASYL